MAAAPSLFKFLLVLLASAVKALDKVPANETFRYVNQGEYGEFINEYDATYRTTLIGTSPFQLMWYNTTPGAYFVALRMGTSRSESVRRWVWEANRGRPVGENATLTFGTDGNLVIAEADGTVAWSTGTANKGVVGLRVLPNGNIVLYDKKDRFLWQSFDHPTDTLMIGQSLPVGGAKKLISRKSISDGSPGPYTLVMGTDSPILYVDASPKPLPYFRYDPDMGYSKTNGRVTFQYNAPDNVSYELTLNGRILTVTKYDSVLSFLRLEPDGDLVIYTYDDRVDYQAWEKTFTLFTPVNFLSACYKPARCGSLGVCDNEMCVGCPTEKGLLGWSASCAPPQRGSCKVGANHKYFKVDGVENFLARYTTALNATGVDDCRRRCSADCKCLGFLFWEEASKCWLAPVLGTLDKVSNPKHVLYIKSK
ncbi:unnamed protein product [Spirodela intermedia]|uniref:Uncharacterized protein n=1 Tax=Spirodela intermedia TaxID=51605 RepID=A0A7I8KZH2_SPIIN|nr:unnamed protein product [Spirodela intermedia]